MPRMSPGEPPSQDGRPAPDASGERARRPPHPEAEPGSPSFDWTAARALPTMTAHETLVRAVEWSKTSMGPMDSWSPTLKTVVRLMMLDTQPVILYWGNDCTIIYNEAYAPLVGEKHPSLQGMRAGDAFPEFWPKFDEILRQQRHDGKTKLGEASMFLMNRRGFLEETYFSWQLIPVIGEDGRVHGSYGKPVDETSGILALRESHCIQGLSQIVARATSTKDLWEATLQGLAVDVKDLPLAMLYSTDGQSCALEGTTRINAGEAIAKVSLDLESDTTGIAPAIAEAIRTKQLVVLEAADPAMEGRLEGIAWAGHDRPSSLFAVVPLKSDDSVKAVLVQALNPYRAYDEHCREFFQAVCRIIESQLSRILLLKEIECRSEMVARAQQEARTSETRFARFAERSSVGFAVANNRREIVYANDAWYDFGGMDPGNADYGAFLDSVHPDDVDIVESQWERALMQKTGNQFQYRSKKPFQQGNMHMDNKTGLCACYADLNEEGEVETMMGFVMDISETKWVEEQLRIQGEQTDMRYRTYAEHCPLGICRTDPNGVVLYGNDAWHQLYGLVRGQYHDNDSWRLYLKDEDLEAYQEFFDGFKKDPGPSTIETRLRDKTYTIKDGDTTIENGMWVLTTGFTEYKPDGSIDYIDFWVTDISSQKMATKILTMKMEEAIRLKTQQERFMDMISHEIRNPLSAVLHCGEEVVEAMKKCDAQMVALNGRRAVLKDGIQGQDDGLLLSLKNNMESALDAANTIMYCVQHQKQIVDDVLTLSKLDSDMLVVSPVAVQPASLVPTSLKMFEHELRMTGIDLSLYQDESLDRLRVDWVLLDPNRFLQIVINLVTNAIKFTKKSAERFISVTFRASREPPSEEDMGVEFVPRRYAAAKPSSSPTTAAPAVSQHPHDEEGGEDVYIGLSVRDTGKGLTADERALLFGRFAQSPKTHIEYGGSGLGLFISRQITEMLGGRIGMASEPGRGCTFAFFVRASRTLPLAEASPSSAAASIVDPFARLSTLSQQPLTIPRDETSTASGGFSPRLSQAADQTPSSLSPPVPPDATAAPETRTLSILVVEDNYINQKVLCKLLRNRGFTVEAANHGQEALAALVAINNTNNKSTNKDNKNRHHHEKTKAGFDVILCDIEMPVMDGLQFTREVRAMEEEEEEEEGRGVEGRKRIPARRVPIIGVTANVRAQQVNGAIEVGMDGVTTKPYRIDELVGHIRKVCGAAK